MVVYFYCTFPNFECCLTSILKLWIKCPGFILSSCLFFYFKFGHYQEINVFSNFSANETINVLSVYKHSSLLPSNFRSTILYKLFLCFFYPARYKFLFMIIAATFTDWRWSYEFPSQPHFIWILCDLHRRQLLL